MLGQLSREEPYKFIVLYTKDDRVFDLVTEELLANYRIRKDSLQVPASRDKFRGNQFCDIRSTKVIGSVLFYE